MKFIRVWAVARKESLHIIRDPRSLGMAMGIPIMLMILFGYALTLDVDNVPLVVWDQSNTAVSRDYLSRFTGSRYFSLKHRVDNYRQVEHAIDTSEVLVAMIIPRDFDRQIKTRQITPVQLIIDGTDANTATLAMSYAEALSLDWSRQIAIQNLYRISGITIHLPLDIRPRVWFNEDLESRNFIFPGLIAVIMMIIAALLTSLTVAREWEQGTMEQLVSTPIKSGELILGKLLPYFAVGMIDVTIAVLMGQFLFHVPLRGSPVLLFAVSAIFLTGVLSLGIFVSVITRNQLLASQVTMILTFVPSFLLSGFVFPISNMPLLIQILTYIIPARFFLTILKGIYLKNIGIHVLALEIIYLTLFGIVMVFLSHMKFKKKLRG